MKTKSLVFILVGALVTLSFTFSSVKKEKVKTAKAPISTVQVNEPVGGFVTEDKF
jgi:hypothetical protein